MGYCRPCCTNQREKFNECENCLNTPKNYFPTKDLEDGISIKSFVLYGIMFIGFILSCFILQAYCLQGGFNGLCFGVSKNNVDLEWVIWEKLNARLYQI